MYSAVGQLNLQSNFLSPLLPNRGLEAVGIYDFLLPGIRSPPPFISGMSGRLIAAVGRLPATRPAMVRAIRQYHQLPSGGILRADAAVRATRRRMWFPINSFHNAVIVRNASFARFLPRLVVKFIRIPAMAGGVMIGGLAWIQYQATRTSVQEHYS